MYNFGVSECKRVKSLMDISQFITAQALEHGPVSILVFSLTHETAIKHNLARPQILTGVMLLTMLGHTVTMS